jgi:hypothetical protein
MSSLNTLTGLGRKRKRTTRRGRGWLTDVWDGIKSVAGPINDVLKSTKILSTAASAIPQTRGFAPVVGALGYGRRKKRRSRTRCM